MISSIGQNQSVNTFGSKIPNNAIKCPAIPDGFVSTSRRVLMNPEELSADVFQSSKDASGQLFSAIDSVKTRLEEFRAPSSSKYEEVKYKGAPSVEKPTSNFLASIREQARNYFQNIDDVTNGINVDSIDKNLS